MDLHQAHALVIRMVREAGSIALQHFSAGGVPFSSKEDQSPVTPADLAVEDFLAQRLGGVFPTVGWLSEEGERPQEYPRQWMWVVDPIDGTRNFITGGDEWVISVALVKDGRPMVAALCRPSTGDIYDAVLHGGARLNGRPIRLSDGPLESVGMFTGPKKIFKELAMRMPAATWLRSCPSVALRMARLAEGTIDTALVKAGAHDWDLAAADLILSEAGGRLTTTRGDEPLYDGRAPCQPDLIAAGPQRLDALVMAIRTKQTAFA